MEYNEFVQELDAMDPAELALGAGMIGIMLVLMLFSAIIWYFLSSIGYFKMFKKANEAGWKAFVPFYNVFILFKMSWQTKLFWIYLAASLIGGAVAEAESVIVSLIGLVILIVALVLMIKLKIRLARSFGKGTGWGVLLVFFPFIITLILGFGSAQYIGNTTEDKEV